MSGFGDILSDFFGYSPQQKLARQKALLEQENLLGPQNARSLLTGGAYIDPDTGRVSRIDPMTTYSPVGGGQMPQQSVGQQLFAPQPMNRVSLLDDTSQGGMQRRNELLRQANPEPFLSSATSQAVMGPKLQAAGLTPWQQTAFMLDPKAAAEGMAKSAFPTQTDFVKDLVAAGLQPGTPEFSKAMADRRLKETYIAEQDPLKRQEIAASIGEKQAQAGAANARTNLMQNTGIDDQTIEFRAQMAAAGDMENAYRGIPNSIYGSQARAAISARAAQLAHTDGATGADQAAKNSEFFGIKAGQRALGTRQANVDMSVQEADKMADLALQASEKVPRGGFVPVNKAIVAWNSNTGDPDTRAFGAANNSFINAYATAIGKGTPTVSGQEHAREMLTTADSPQAYRAIIAQLRKEMAAAKEAPRDVRRDLSGTVSGRQDQAPQSVQPVQRLRFNPATGKIE